MERKYHLETLFGFSVIVYEYEGQLAVLKEDVIVLGPPVIHQTQARFFPVQPVV